MVKAKVYIYDKPFDGFPEKDNFKLIEEQLPPIKNGEFLAEAVYFSLDPYTVYYTPGLILGKPFMSLQVARIIESKNPKFPVGQHIVGSFGWRTHTISDGKPSATTGPITVVPKLGDLPLSLALGVLGVLGATAYFGFLEICTPQAGEIVVVTGAAGAVGSHVCQIAKIKGCKVIGITGSDEKGKWLVEDLGVDHFINYKTADLDAVLTEYAPEGADCYFDNVGGEISSIILRHMRSFGRISVCGTAPSVVNDNPEAATIQRPMISFNLTMEGFEVTRWSDKWNQAYQQNLKWIKSGKLKYRETVTEGFENMFTAFTDMLNGKHIGKAVLKV